MVCVSKQSYLCFLQGFEELSHKRKHVEQNTKGKFKIHE